MALSNYLEEKILNENFRTGTIYVALYTNDPTDLDVGTEVSGGSYTRQTVAFSEPTQDVEGKAVISNSNEVVFPTATSDWGTITHVGFRSAATGGNLLFYGPLVNPKKIDAGDRFRAMAGDLTLKLR
ncbi:hypothetical protein D1872_113760 [compost metagenome]